VKLLISTVKIITIIATFALWLGYVSICQPAEAAQTPGLFVSPSDSSTVLDNHAAADSTIFRSRLVRIDWNLVNSRDGMSQKQTTKADRLVLNLFEDAVFNAALDRREVHSAKKINWSGHIESVQPSQVILMVENGVMVGNIRVADSYFQVRYVGADLHVVQQIDESRFPQDGEPIPVYLPAQGTVQDFAIAAADDASMLDVMVVYTSAARAAAGGTTAMNALINLAVAETNTAYARSGVFPRLRLVHAEEVAYAESGNFSTDLNRLTNRSDGFMDNVHALRDVHGADLVSLIVEGTSLCGIAWLMTAQSNAFEAFAFSVVARICATGNYTFGHEIGHNMGLQHDRANAPADGVFPFSHGYVDTPHGFRDIMGVAASCGGCIRMQNFSNPNVMFNGFPTGVSQSSPQSADAAASLNATAFTVANWRAQVTAPPLVAVDFDGDGRSDTGVYRGGTWFVLRSSDGGMTATGLGGLLQDIPVPEDYDGDGETDIAVYRDGTWFIIRSSDGGFTVTSWGGVLADIPVPGDYDGDGRADVAVYLDGTWFIILSSDSGFTVTGWGGLAQDIPVPADYDGDGRADIAIYRGGLWLIRRSFDGLQTAVGWGGLPQDIVVPGDYDGDGKADVAVYRDGTWFIVRSSDGDFTVTGWGGLPQDIPVPTDYDGDGKTDIAIYRNGGWYILRSSDGAMTYVQLGGAADDIPLN
jgi:predicted small integral membrane protein